MEKYVRQNLKITEFEVEDVITTSGTDVPSNPQSRKTYSSNGDVYSAKHSQDQTNWLGWF